MKDIKRYYYVKNKPISVTADILTHSHLSTYLNQYKLLYIEVGSDGKPKRIRALHPVMPFAKSSKYITVLATGDIEVDVRSAEHVLSLSLNLFKDRLNELHITLPDAMFAAIEERFAKALNNFKISYKLKAYTLTLPAKLKTVEEPIEFIDSETLINSINGLICEDGMEDNKMYNEFLGNIISEIKTYQNDTNLPYRIIALSYLGNYLDYKLLAKHGDSGVKFCKTPDDATMKEFYKDDVCKMNDLCITYLDSVGKPNFKACVDDGDCMNGVFTWSSLLDSKTTGKHYIRGVPIHDIGIFKMLKALHRWGAKVIDNIPLFIRF